MYRLLYKSENMHRVFWMESDDLQSLRKHRETLLAWAHYSGISWTLAPYILDVSKSETISIGE